MLKIIAMPAAAIPSSSRLNPVQMHLLHLFSRPMSELELKELKMLLVEWYDRKAQEEMDKLWEEKGLSNEKWTKY
ncbi:MAG: hypothetical protein IPM82_07270 [Saprospiraceae bacterium]|nr:hypothetical protein [Saprospiraceae bacterium]